MTKKIILLNAPPGAGKDFAANYLANNINNCKLDKFARVLKERTHALYGFPNRSWNYYEDCKDVSNKDFLKLTPRQAYINVSEQYFKPIHGKRVFGELLLQDLQKCSEEIIAISDSGFLEEAEVLIEKYGEDNVLLIQIHRDGYTFKGDSRDYILLDQCKSHWVINEGDKTFATTILDLVLDWLDNLEEEEDPEDLYFG